MCSHENKSICITEDSRSNSVRALGCSVDALLSVSNFKVVNKHQLYKISTTVYYITKYFRIRIYFSEPSLQNSSDFMKVSRDEGDICSFLVEFHGILSGFRAIRKILQNKAKDSVRNSRLLSKHVASLCCLVPFGSDIKSIVNFAVAALGPSRTHQDTKSGVLSALLTFAISYCYLLIHIVTNMLESPFGDLLFLCSYFDSVFRWIL